MLIASKNISSNLKKNSLMHSFHSTITFITTRIQHPPDMAFRVLLLPSTSSIWKISTCTFVSYINKECTEIIGFDTCFSFILPISDENAKIIFLLQYMSPMGIQIQFSLRDDFFSKLCNFLHEVIV